jgi:DNA polymerase-3 subunit delta'
MSFLPPTGHQYLYGHAEAAAQLKKSFDDNKLHHAIILAGPGGIGKETLAYQLIRYALAFHAEKPVQDNLKIPEEHRVAKQITAKSHAHLFVIEPVYDEKKGRFKRDITLGALDGLTNFLRLAPTDDAPRFIIINPADGMNLQTQNALLKLLEEPPANTHFLLLTSQIGSLLPTIRSRCLTLQLEALNLDDFTKTIFAIQPSFADENIQPYFYLSSGAPGLALENEEIGLFETYGSLTNAILGWIDDNDSEIAMRIAEELSRDDVLADRIVETLLARLSIFLKSRITGVPVNTIIPEEERVFEFWSRVDETKILGIYDRINALWQSCEAGYLDKKLILLQIFGLLSTVDSQKQAMLP